MAGFPQVCFIKNTVTNPNIVVGDYTYYDDPDDSENVQILLKRGFSTASTLKITGRRQAQLAGGPVDCDVSHAFLPVCDERLRELPKAKMPE